MTLKKRTGGWAAFYLGYPLVVVMMLSPGRLVQNIDSVLMPGITSFIQAPRAKFVGQQFLDYLSFWNRQVAARWAQNFC